MRCACSQRWIPHRAKLLPRVELMLCGWRRWDFADIRGEKGGVQDVHEIVRIFRDQVCRKSFGSPKRMA
jgi:hypothetical protein